MEFEKDKLNENNSNDHTSQSKEKEFDYISQKYNEMLKTRQLNIDDSLNKSEQKRIEKYNKEISEQEAISYNKRLEQLKTRRLELDEEMKEYEQKQKQSKKSLFK